MGQACTMPVHGLNPACHCATDGAGGRAEGVPAPPELPVVLEAAGLDEEPVLEVDFPRFFFLLVVAPPGTLGEEVDNEGRPA